MRIQEKQEYQTKNQLNSKNAPRENVEHFWELMCKKSLLNFLKSIDIFLNIIYYYYTVYIGGIIWEK